MCRIESMCVVRSAGVSACGCEETIQCFRYTGKRWCLPVCGEDSLYVCMPTQSLYVNILACGSMPTRVEWCQCLHVYALMSMYSGVWRRCVVCMCQYMYIYIYWHVSVCKQVLVALSKVFISSFVKGMNTGLMGAHIHIYTCA